jgi:hypothetical protein
MSRVSSSLLSNTKLQLLDALVLIFVQASETSRPLNPAIFQHLHPRPFIVRKNLMK